MFLGFDFRGIPSKIIPQFWRLIFTPPRTGGNPGALGVWRIKNLHKTKRCIKQKVAWNKKQPAPNLGGSLLWKCQNSKILFGPPTSPAFRPRFPGLWAKNQNSAPKVLFALLSQFWKGVTGPPYPKAPGGDRFGRNPLFRGPGLTPRALGSESPTQHYLWGVKRALIIFGRPSNESKVTALFC